MKILSIETSCDETAAAIVSKDPQEDYVKILSSTVASSIFLHSKTGGIIPETAAREQLKYITPVIDKTINDSKLKTEDLDAIAVTMGPGLIGSLLVGVETAKTLAYIWKKPIIPVNHLLGHIYANWLTTNDQRLKTIEFPLISLLVSGGHTDLLLLESHKKIRWLGGTLDDAAGEAFDKIGRLLNLPYPGGPAIEKASERGDINRFTFPSPMIYSKDFNFSFSGLKAAVWRETKTIQQFNNKIIANISASVQKSIIEVLVRKTMKAAQKYNVESILLGGGVATNQKLREELELKIKNSKLKIPLFVPEKRLCTDNAAMIGAYAAFHPKEMPWRKITANPELYF
ncbi:MAG: tRNA (adenosine(37)-N6)-threonylcarbamoyltransferase complex transferase subunit TsaD [Candidatus Levybacteria bacterium]|nr:tRNA (adenosine(37)-N6)-threonylcarbamoyltransferase complex transferase subunit TsaD [Candidatus Levybacteria bacterium]